jgi:DNA-binding CsgD family transcriptional regulator
MALFADRMLNVCLLAPGVGNDIVSALSFYRPMGSEAFSGADVELLGHLAPHLVTAARNFFSVQSLHLLESLRRDALDAVAVALMAIDSGGRLLFANQLAEELLRAGTLLRLAGGIVSPGTAVAEKGSLVAALARLRQGSGATALLTDRSSGLQVTLSAVPAGHAGLTGPAIGLIWLTSMAAEASPVQQIAQLFGLTAAEERLLLQLAAGEDLRGAADALEVTVNTTRTQLQSIFRKTGRRTQAHLMQLVGRMAAIRTPRPYDGNQSRRSGSGR